MGTYIGSALKDGNWGEDFFVKKLIDYFDDSYVIYRNRPIFGAQFDVCLFAPNIGIIIFEVKAWKPDTILRVENGDSIVIKCDDKFTGEVKEKRENPTTQARGYVYKMRSRIRQKTGKIPLIYSMVCFPNLNKSSYEEKGIHTVCEYEGTLLREDLESRHSFMEKMNLCIKNHKNFAKYHSEFTDELMFRARQIFETDVKIVNQSIENTDLIDRPEIGPKFAYSVLAYIPHDKNSKTYIEEMAKKYACGTKLYLFVSSLSDLYLIQEAVNDVLFKKGLVVVNNGLEIDFSRKKKFIDNVRDESFSIFNCAAYLIPGNGMPASFFSITDGNITSESIRKAVQFANDNSNFNFQQYSIEHCETQKNVIVRAGAGTGKTYTMISRIAFICHHQLCAMKEMANRIVMITFTDDAANQMEEKIKSYFNNYYLLTGDIDCLAFINQIEGMQISTIHSYAKKIISQLGIEHGYGTEVSITSGDYKLKQIIANKVDSYIIDAQQKKGLDYVRKLGMPIYQINKDIFNLIYRLHNQSVDVAGLKNINFGNPISEEGMELHNLIETVVPEIEEEADLYFRKHNLLHLNNMMSLLKSCIDNEENRQRLVKMQTGRPQFMFVDEFQDTDDVQINILTQIANLLQYKLFVVGDVKQCIYRFRGAKENAFEQLEYENNPAWLVYSLTKNYRTDRNLLNLYHNTFALMGDRKIDGEPLLIYGADNNEESGKLIGTRIYNENNPVNFYYKKISISEEAERIPALFLEIERRKRMIQQDIEKNGSILSKKEKEIAILVRENWQAELIKKEGKSKNVEVITNTGGDLYMSAPALDMLTLANALLHYDEADYLYALISSNFIGGGVSKAQMYSMRVEKTEKKWRKAKLNEADQTEELIKRINKELAESELEDGKWSRWSNIIRALRTTPVLQVLRKIYCVLKPWVKYGLENHARQYYYRANVDLLFEELIQSSNKDSLSINSLVDILSANIVSQKNVDSRVLETDNTTDVVIRCVTVHKAKGLEYGSVILPYCSNQINRMKRTDINVSVIHKDITKVGYQIKYDEDHLTATFQNDYFDENLEKSERMREEARILYVAMTRAIRSFSWISVDGKNNDCWQNLIWEE